MRASTSQTALFRPLLFSIYCQTMFVFCLMYMSGINQHRVGQSCWMFVWIIGVVLHQSNTTAEAAYIGCFSFWWRVFETVSCIALFILFSWQKRANFNEPRITFVSTYSRRFELLLMDGDFADDGPLFFELILWDLILRVCRTRGKNCCKLLVSARWSRRRIHRHCWTL